MPANGLRGRLRAPPRRLLAVLALVIALALALVALLYAGARLTSVFAVQRLEITGGKQAVREAARPMLGVSLVGLDQDELARRLEQIPALQGFRVDRAFPHTLRIAVVQERPLAVVSNGAAGWLVSARGRVIRQVDPSVQRKRPVVWAGSESTLAPGATVQAADVRAALAALRLRPDGFPRVQSARASDGSVTLLLASGLELRLGTPEDLALKLAVTARIMRRLGAQGLAELAYLDASVPERVVAGTTLNSQLEG